MRRFYLLDTNVISDISKPIPNPSLKRRLLEKEKLCTISSTTWNEILYGINIMPESHKKNYLFAHLIDNIQIRFPIVQFDNHAAWIQADLRAKLKKAGKTIDYADTEIASIAIANQLILITNNTKHFEEIAKVDSCFYFENWFEE